MNSELEMFCNRLLSALLNGGYQGLLLTVAVGCGLKCLPRVNAATRHMIWLVTLLFLVLLPLMHFVSGSSSEVQAVPKNDLAETDRSLADGESSELPGDSSTGSDEIGGESRLDDKVILLLAEAIRRSREPDSSEEPSVENSLLRREVADAIQSFFPTRNRDSSHDSPPSQLEELSAKPLMQLFPMASLNWRILVPGYVGIALVGTWILLSSMRLVNLVTQCCWLRSLKRRAISAPESLQVIFETLAAQMKVSRTTRLLTCDECPAPMAAGLGCPVVLLPSKLIADAGSTQIEQVLRHELAHVSRWDDWTNLGQQTIKALLFFHPAVWWLSRRLTVEREIACDDHVLAAIQKPKSYALLLTEFASRSQCPEITAAPAAWSNNNHLKERITMILDSTRNSSPRLARTKTGLLTAAAALVTILILQTGPRLVLAEQEQSKKSSAASSVSKEAQEKSETTAIIQSNEELPDGASSKVRRSVISKASGESAPSISITESGPKIKSRVSLDSSEEKPFPVPTPRPPAPPLTIRPSIDVASPVIAHASTVISVPSASSDDAVSKPVPQLRRNQRGLPIRSNDA